MDGKAPAPGQLNSQYTVSRFTGLAPSVFACVGYKRNAPVSIRFRPTLPPNPSSTPKRIPIARRIMRHRHCREMRVDADAAGEDAGIGDQHVAGAVEAALRINHSFGGIEMHRVAALRV